MKTNILIILLVSLIVFSCKKESTIETSINGLVQKGPFNNGTTINVYELSEDLIPTGNVFNSQIENNSGIFNINSLHLESSKIKIEANGYYFNEVLGENSDGPLTLYALSDISNKTNINVNIITYIEKARVEHLLNLGVNYNAAKCQAQLEIFQIFNISISQYLESETLDIMQTGNGNAALLAISAILQGYRNTADLSQFLAELVNDFKTDGIIDNVSLQTDLISHIKIANLDKIRANLLEYYAEIGLSSTVVPNFESYIQQFIDNTNYAFVNPVKFPDNGNYGPNILSENNTNFISTSTAGENWYSVAANLPYGVSMRVEVNNLGYTDNNIDTHTWWSNTGELYIYSNDPTEYCDLQVCFGYADTVLVKVYFNDASTPFITRTLYVN